MGGNFHPGFESLSLRHFKVLRSIWASWDWPFFLVVLEWACRELSWAGKKVSCLFSLYIWRFRKKSENSQFSIFALNNFNRLWGRNSRILTFYEIVIFEYRLQIWEDQNGIPVSQPRIQTRLPWGVSNRFCFDFLFWHARSVLIYSHRYCYLTLKLQNLMFRFVNI